MLTGEGRLQSAGHRRERRLDNSPKTIRISRYWVVAVVGLLLLIGSNVALKKSIFSEGVSDGFYSQIVYVSLKLQGFYPHDAWEPLHFVHIVRLVIVAPFFGIWFAKLPPFLETVALVPFLWPILAAKFRGNPNWAQLIILLCPLALSYRTVLLACGFAYLYLFLFSDRPRTWMLALSGLFAFLSSGVVLAWILVAIVCYDRVLSPWYRRVGLISFVGAGFAASLLHKADYFASASQAQTKSTGLASAIERSTLFVSYEYGQLGRLLLYVTLLSVALWFMLQLLRRLPETRRLLLFFAACLPGFLFEGLAVMAFILPFALAVCGAYRLEPATRRDASLATGRLAPL